MSRAQPATRHIPDFELPSAAPRFSVANVADIAISAQHYREPEVNRLKARAMEANADIARNGTRKALPDTLPAGFAISFMVGFSLLVWSILAAVVSLVL